MECMHITNIVDIACASSGRGWGGFFALRLAPSLARQAMDEHTHFMNQEIIEDITRFVEGFPPKRQRSSPMFMPEAFAGLPSRPTFGVPQTPSPRQPPASAHGGDGVHGPYLLVQQP